MGKTNRSSGGKLVAGWMWSLSASNELLAGAESKSCTVAGSVLPGRLSEFCLPEYVAALWFIIGGACSVSAAGSCSPRRR